MSKSTELAIVPPAETALAVFSAENGLEPWLQKIRVEIDGFTPDVSSRKGREAIASMAYKVARSKTALDDAGKALVAELKEVPKKIDAERKRMRETLEAWQEEVRRPLNEWQAAEDARVDRHQAVIDHIKAVNTDGLSASMIGAMIQDLDSCEIGAELEEYEAEAHRAKAASLITLRAVLIAQEKIEADEAELARLRAEAEDRAQKDRDAEIARQAAERATREAAAQAQAERDAAAQREQALKDQAAQAQRQAEQDRLSAEAAAERQRLQLEFQAEQARSQAAQAERDRIAAEQQAERDRLAAIERQAQAVEAAKQAEIRRQADEAAEADRQAKAREADVAHKAAVLTSIKEVFMKAGITEEQARAVINLIRKGEAPNVSITY